MACHNQFPIRRVVQAAGGESKSHFIDKFNVVSRFWALRLFKSKSEIPLVSQFNRFPSDFNENVDFLKGRQKLLVVLDRKESVAKIRASFHFSCGFYAQSMSR